MKTQNCENNYLFPGILSTLERARLHYGLQNKHSTMCNAKRQTSRETEKLIRQTIQIIPNTIHHSTQTFSEIQPTLKRPNSLPLQTETKFSVILCACLWRAGNPSLWKPWPKPLASQEVSWPYLTASAGTCKSLVASQLERHIYFKLSAYCAPTGTFILYYQHNLYVK